MRSSRMRYRAGNGGGYPKPGESNEKGGIGLTQTAQYALILLHLSLPLFLSKAAEARMTQVTSTLETRSAQPGWSQPPAFLVSE